MPELLSTMAQVPLIYGCSAVFEAIDATTGNPVTGVVITDPVVYGYDLTVPDDTTAATVALVSPLFVPIPVGDIEPVESDPSETEMETE